MVSNAYKHLMRCNRKINPAHEMMTAKCRRANIGPVRAFKLFKELVGSYDEVGCTSVEFKNYARDMRAFANGVGAKILLEKLEHKHDFCSGFTFEYCMDKWKQVKTLFWADSISIQNYQIFGHTVSFDATYTTNKYKMIFAPFTRKDNHGKCVTFGAGLLTSKDFESYSWLLTKFADCMKTTPKMIITDEDPALNKAVATVLSNTRHRFCMWHIIIKLAEKVLHALNEDPNFKQKFHNIVWSEVDDPAAFQEQWDEVMSEYGLTGHKWFIKIFALQTFWIPVYFHDLEMSGLFKTTSLSESENSFFQQYLNTNSDFAEFYIHFRSALDAQRNAHDKLTYNDKTDFLDLKTYSDIEHHAASVYTFTIFLKVQSEIEAATEECRIMAMHDVGERTCYVVAENDGCKYEVERNMTEDLLTYSYKHYIWKGMLCRHVFVMMLNMNMKSIPEQYICKRWTKFACSNVIRECKKNGDPDGSRNNDLFSEACKCIGLVDGDPERKAQLLEIFKEASAKFAPSDGQDVAAKGKEAIFEQYYGYSKLTSVRLLPPPVVSTKGSTNRQK